MGAYKPKRQRRKVAKKARASAAREKRIQAVERLIGRRWLGR
jgi:hypothetical protein